MKKLLLIVWLVVFSAPVYAANKDSVYDRVMRTGTIRCGYVIYPPNTMKDPNSGEIYGMSPDIVKAVADGLGLRVEWTEEVGTASMIEGLETGRYDMLCTAAWLNLPRARVAAFSRPVYYTVVNAVSRADDARFDDNLALINDPAIKIGSVDGSAYTVIAQTQFPKARVVSYPNMTDLAQPLEDVKAGKADVAFMENYILNRFIDNNPDAVKQVPADKPVKVFQNSFLLKGDDLRFAHMINVALTHMLNNDDVDRIIARYETYPGSFKRVARPYED